LKERQIKEANKLLHQLMDGEDKRATQCFRALDASTGVK
jgi:hypothetical protein